MWVVTYDREPFCLLPAPPKASAEQIRIGQAGTTGQMTGLDPNSEGH